MVELRDFRVVHIPADHHQVIGTGLPDKLNQALPLMRKIRPGLIAVVLDAELRAGGKDAEVRRLLKLLFQPGPLLLAEQRGRLVGMGGVVQVIEKAARPVSFTGK